MLKLLKRPVILFTLFFTGFACSNMFSSFSTEKAKKVVELSKGACFGNCPVFNFVVYDNGVLSFEGVRYTQRKGMHFKKVNKEKLQEIKGVCETANLWRFNEIYRSRLPDAQTVTIIYYDESGRAKKITGKEDRPEEVLEVEEYLNDLAFSSGWTSPTKGDDTATTVNTDLIVKLRSGIDALAWSQKYEAQDLNLKEALSADKTYWKISFNTEKINPQDMIRLLRGDSDVFSVQPDASR